MIIFLEWNCAPWKIFYWALPISSLLVGPSETEWTWRLWGEDDLVNVDWLVKKQTKASLFTIENKLGEEKNKKHKTSRWLASQPHSIGSLRTEPGGYVIGPCCLEPLGEGLEASEQLGGLEFGHKPGRESSPSKPRWRTFPSSQVSEFGTIWR